MDEPEVPLDDHERQVLAALANLEGRRGPARVDEVAAEAGLDRGQTRDVLSRLLQEDKELVRELAGEEPDLGPRYQVKGAAG